MAKRVDDTDEFDLGARSRHQFALYGGEPVRVTDLRGEPTDDPWVEVSVLNVTIHGRRSTLAGLARLLVSLLEGTEWDVESCEQIPGPARRRGEKALNIHSPFSGRVPIRPTPDGD